MVSLETFGSSSTSQQASSTQQSCVTKLCDQGGKNYRNWSRLEKSKRMIEYYQRTRRSDLSGGFLYEVHGDNSDPKSRQFTGTYVPQELILEIASWVSIEFYDKCNKIILNYFVNEFKKMNKSALEEKIKQVEQLEEQMESLETVKIKDDKIDQLLESNSLFWNRRNIRNKR